MDNVLTKNVNVLMIILETGVNSENLIVRDVQIEEIARIQNVNV